MSRAWPMVPLGDVLTERKEVPSSVDIETGTIRIVSKIGFNEGKIELRSGFETKTGMILIQPGDIVVSGINAAKGAIAIYDEENTEPIAATIHYGAYIPSKGRVDIRFLWWLLRSRTFRDILTEYVPGGIKTELKAKRLLPIPVPLPPLSEQKRITARIEELSVKIEEARGLRRQAIKEAEVQVPSALSALQIVIDGRLEDVLLDRPRNGWSSRCDNAENGIPILSLGAVTGFRYRENEFKRTSQPTDKSAHYWLKEGDLLITRSNTPELVGHVAIYNGKPSPCIYPDLMMRLDVDGLKADRRFVHKWIGSTPARDYIRSKAKGTSPTMKKISQGIVMDIPFPSRLSLPEQRRIVAYLDGFQAKVDALKRLQSETASELNAMLPSVLDRAFRGELV